MRVLMVWAAIVCLVGCTTMRPIPIGTAASPRILANGLVGPGDQLRVQTIDHRIHQLTVVAVDANNLVGERESIAIDQILSIDRREHSRTGILVIVGAAIVVVISVIALGLRHGVGLPAGAG